MAVPGVNDRDLRNTNLIGRNYKTGRLREKTKSPLPVCLLAEDKQLKRDACAYPCQRERLRGFAKQEPGEPEAQVCVSSLLRLAWLRRGTAVEWRSR